MSISASSFDIDLALVEAALATHPPALSASPPARCTPTNPLRATRRPDPETEKDWRETFSPAGSEELVERRASPWSIFMSKGKIYFKSNTFGVQTLIEFPLSSIVSIKPKIMTPLVYPVAIKIVYILTALNARDEFRAVPLALWRKAAPDNFSSFVNKMRAAKAAGNKARASFASSAPRSKAVKPSFDTDPVELRASV